MRTIIFAVQNAIKKSSSFELGQNTVSCSFHRPLHVTEQEKTGVKEQEWTETSQRLNHKEVKWTEGKVGEIYCFFFFFSHAVFFFLVGMIYLVVVVGVLLVFFIYIFSSV